MGFSTGVLGSWRAMGSASAYPPSLCRCIPAAEAKFCLLHSPLDSAVDGEMPGLSCPGQRGTDLLLGSVRVSHPEPRAPAVGRGREQGMAVQKATGEQAQPCLRDRRAQCHHTVRGKAARMAGSCVRRSGSLQAGHPPWVLELNQAKGSFHEWKSLWVYYL